MARSRASRAAAARRRLDTTSAHQEAAKTSLAKTDRNRFAVLDDHAAISFLHLPGELRNMCYGYMILDDPGANYARGTNYTMSIVVKEPRQILYQKRPLHYLREIRGLPAVLFVSRQIHVEFTGALAGHAPHYALLEFNVPLNQGILSAPITCKTLEPIFGLQEDKQVGNEGPVSRMQARGLFLQVDITAHDYESEEKYVADRDKAEQKAAERSRPGKTVWPEDPLDTYSAHLYTLISEDYLNKTAVESDVFKRLAERLKMCKYTEDLWICLRPGAARASLVHLQHADEDDPNVVFNKLVEVVESMPQLLRYKISASCGPQVFAARKKNQSWDAPEVVRSSRRYWDAPEDGEAQLRDDLISAAIADMS